MKLEIRTADLELRLSCLQCSLHRLQTLAGHLYAPALLLQLLRIVHIPIEVWAKNLAAQSVVEKRHAVKH